MRKLLFLLIFTVATLFSQEMNQNIKTKKIYPKGEKIYSKLCQTIHPVDYATFNELKQSIQTKHLCKPMSASNFEALTLYLWEVKREEHTHFHPITVGEKERCPVCAMFVSKYPRWVAQITYNNKSYYFDGVKDLMKFYFDPQQWGEYPFTKEEIKSIFVTDYYTQNTIEGKKAYYVIGSDVYGPMGNELIPFASLHDAKIFKKDHNAKEILTFEDITQKGVYQLDAL
ncbi:MAG: nitrous oxide reductase accessory protein NosL [Candidatus Marinarcus sp.]|uniref:nitrous oxide reductase accessory protein NosL n=1 Tax=Candidatus Marinarcus sp. TaxID=3100987 RepID=UPI003B003BA6